MQRQQPGLPQQTYQQAAANPMLSQVQNGYHPTEGLGFQQLSAQQFQELNRQNSPSTTANVPASGGFGGFVPPDYRVPADYGYERPGQGFAPIQSAKDAIQDEILMRRLGIGAAAIGGTGLAGMGINAMQGDSNGNLLQNPMTQAALLGGVGAGIGYGVVDFHQGRNPIQSPEGSYANRQMTQCLLIRRMTLSSSKGVRFMHLKRISNTSSSPIVKKVRPLDLFEKYVSMAGTPSWDCA